MKPDDSPSKKVQQPAGNNRIPSIVLLAAGTALGISYLWAYTAHARSSLANKVEVVQYAPTGTCVGANPPDILTKAESDLAATAAYRVKNSFEDHSGDPILEDRVVSLAPDGTRFERTEYFFVNKNSKKPNDTPFMVIVKNAEGDWRLLNKVAIRFPDTRANAELIGKAVISSIDPKKSGAPPLYWTEPAQQSDGSVLIVRRVEAEEAVGERIRVVDEMISHKTQSDATKAGKLSGAKFVNARSEYWVEAATAQLLRERRISAAGTVLSDITYERITKPINHNIFEVPAGVALKFPRTREAFGQLIAKYTSRILETTNEQYKR